MSYVTSLNTAFFFINTFGVSDQTNNIYLEEKLSFGNKKKTIMIIDSVWKTDNLHCS